MERSAVELDSIRGSLLSVTASTDVVNQQRLAGDVRALRDELGSLAEGMSEAFEEHAAQAFARGAHRCSRRAVSDARARRRR